MSRSKANFLIAIGICAAMAAGCGAALSSSGLGLDADSSSEGTTETGGADAGSHDATLGATTTESADGDDGAQSDGACVYEFPIPATWSTSGCVFSPSDVACDAASDCVAYEDQGHCLCLVPVWGVNRGNEGGCGVPPPCVPGLCRDNQPTGFLTEDCRIVSEPGDIDVACVNHRCFTSARVGDE